MYNSAPIYTLGKINDLGLISIVKSVSSRNVNPTILSVESARSSTGVPKLAFLRRNTARAVRRFPEKSYREE